jgi:hypothetical protein
MSLLETSEERKARLIALRRRKAGEVVDDDKYVFLMLQSSYSTDGWM